MAVSIATSLLLLIPFLCLAALSSAATVTYDFDIGWVTTNPDGMADRPTIGINGQWPIPRIEANVGDRVIVHVLNSLGNQSTSLHFHGLFMNGTTHMDGPSQVTQCAIGPGSRFTYNFTVSYGDAPSEGAELMPSGQSTGDVLVPFPHQRPVSRWPQGPTHHS